MQLINFRAENIFSKSKNSWARKEIESINQFRISSINGFSQSSKNQTTHILERALVDIDIQGEKSKEAILSQLIDLETGSGLQRKINFAKHLGLPLHYVLHNPRSGRVYVLELYNLVDVKIAKAFKSYEAFAGYISEIKGWKSKKELLAKKGLPELDNALRKHKSPWPANLDALLFDANSQPVAILEFQNAKTTLVEKVDMNDYFLCKKMKRQKVGGYEKIVFFDDIRRWMSLELLRVQSQLPLINIVWSPDQSTYQINVVDQITFPDFATYDTHHPWENVEEYKMLLHDFAIEHSEETEKPIRMKKALSFWKLGNRNQEVFHNPPLSFKEKSFPYIYWKKRTKGDIDKDNFKHSFLEVMDFCNLH